MAARKAKSLDLPLTVDEKQFAMTTLILTSEGDTP